MYVVRPVRESDHARLLDLASSIAGGLTTLPRDHDHLRGIIDDSLRAFNPRVRQPGSELYLFVLEHLPTGDVVGTSGVAARVGGFDPFYSYEIRRERFVHAPLGIDRQVSVLHLKETHRGPSEIRSLYLRPDARHGGLGRLLSLSRFLFMRALPSRFDTTVIAEMRGYIDQEGRSPFWEAVGRHFFERDFYTADFLSGLGHKDFIADLMPELPIYLALLPSEVQAVVGKVHHDTQPALALLQSEGFVTTDEVDIFDAGPLVRAETRCIRSVSQARDLTLSERHAESADLRPTHLVARSGLDFRAALAAPRFRGEKEISLTETVAQALELNPGDNVSVVTLK